MKRNFFGALLFAFSFFCAWFMALNSSMAAQQLGKVPRIGILFIGSRNQPHLEAFKQGLRDMGTRKVKTFSWSIVTPKAEKTDSLSSPAS